MLSTASTALRNFELISQNRFRTVVSFNLLRNFDRWLDSRNILGDQVNNSENVGIPVDVVMLYHMLSPSYFMNPIIYGIFIDPVLRESWELLVSNFIVVRHSIFSLNCDEDPMLISGVQFEELLDSIGIDQNDRVSIRREICISANLFSHELMLNWGRSSNDTNVSVHLSYLVLAIFNTAVRSNLPEGIVYRLMCVVLSRLLNLASLGGNRLVISSFLEILGNIMSFNMFCLASVQGNQQMAMERSVIVVKGSCERCNRRFLIPFTCFQEQRRWLGVWNLVGSYMEVTDSLIMSVRELIYAMPIGQMQSEQVLVAFLDFLTDQVCVMINESSTLPVMRLGRTVSPCSLTELSLLSINSENTNLRDPSILSFVIGAELTHNDPIALESRRGEFIRMAVANRILSSGAFDSDFVMNRFLSFVQLMTSDVDPGPVSTASWISFVRLVRMSSGHLIQYELFTRTISALEILQSRMESSQENRDLLCRSFSLVVAFLVQECFELENHEMIRALSNFIFRSLSERADEIIGSQAELSLENVESEFIVNGSIRPPT